MLFIMLVGLVIIGTNDICFTFVEENDRASFTVTYFNYNIYKYDQSVSKVCVSYVYIYIDTSDDRNFFRCIMNNSHMVSQFWLVPHMYPLQWPVRAIATHLLYICPRGNYFIVIVSQVRLPLKLPTENSFRRWLTVHLHAPKLVFVFLKWNTKFKYLGSSMMKSISINHIN